MGKHFFYKRNRGYEILQAGALLMLVLLMVFSLPLVAQHSNIQTASTSGSTQFKIEKGEDVLMLTYFRQRYPTRIEIDENGNTVEVPLPDPMLEAKLHIALSNDGRHWVPLNNNKPVWDHWMRDPYVRRGPDGIWRILTTGTTEGYSRDASGPGCFYATSKDLIHWKEEGTLPLMKDVHDDSGKFLANNIWAPEWFYDEENQEYVLIWSSSFKDAGWKESRLWYSKTKDWKNFTPAKVFFEPSYSVIDGTLLKHDNTYYLFHKEEEFGAKTGERRAIRVATSTNLEGPYQIVEGKLNGGQIVPVITEGPTVIEDPEKSGWLLYYDYCMTNRYGASFSEDLLNWEILEDVNFPADARHGCVSKITGEEARSLINSYSISDGPK
ncbi:glycoside hydrolase family 43 protein [uncultured Draconibacterium sp.]|uniref:glycoside hydrolase family 43 protein n=1 Tax=uncultured Draconibacterium sp. TaxID=1573823 RepID=UPI0029C856F8|nr:glycoside hydrolase family 43 protein [uncultured Draconibacterium sp.]